MKEESDPERKSELQAAALLPEAYRSIHEQYGLELPTDDVVRTWLVLDREFTDSAAEQLVKDYKATITLANLGSADTISTGEQRGEEDPPETNRGTSGGGKPPSLKLEVGMKQDVFALDSGQVTIQWPAMLSEADFEDIGAWLEILKRKIQRCVKGDNEPEPKDGPSE